MWNYLAEQSKLFNLPWIVAGDFTSILSSEERINNGFCNSMGDKDFIDYITTSKLIEPAFSGNYFTWRGGNISQFTARLIMFSSTLYGRIYFINLVLILVITLLVIIPLSVLIL